MFAANEDAPQIVGVIDERPLALRVADYRKSDLWKPIGSIDDNNEEKSKDDTLKMKHKLLLKSGKFVLQIIMYVYECRNWIYCNVELDIENVYDYMMSMCMQLEEN